MERSQHWVVREGSEKDLQGILSLREIVFGEIEKDKLDPEFWKWEFMEGPDGTGRIYLVKEGEAIVGHLADLPKRFSVEGKTVLGSLTLDMMVHPDYRRRGISTATARYGIQSFEKSKSLFMTAYSVRRASIDSLLKTGWKGVTTLPVLVYPLRFRGIANRYLRLPPLSLLMGGMIKLFYLLLFGRNRMEKGTGVEVEEIRKLDEPFDSFWQEALSLFPIMGVRDHAFMNWRYLQHPTRNYTIYRAMKAGEMRGYIVLRKVELLNFNSAVIVDLLALDEAALSALVGTGIRYSREEGADLLGFMVPKGHLYHKVLRGMGFLPSLKAFLFMIYTHSNREIFFSPEKWYVNWGDTDVI
jgi:GNAT superfamily N-acetyltransferase